MAFNVDSLTDYVEQNRLPILRNTNLGVDTARYINKMANVKNVSNLNLIDVEAVIVDRACGWDPSGDTTFSAREMKVRRAQVQAEYCLYDLETKWLGDDMLVRATADHPLEDEKFGEELISGLIEDANAQIELALWQATSEGSEAEGFDGFLAIAEAESETTLVETESDDTVYTKVSKVIAALPASVLKKAAIFMSVSKFTELCQEITAKNLYNYVGEINDELTIVFPGTRIPVHGVDGLEGSDVIFAANPDNLFYGFDLEDDSRAVESGYDKKEGKWYVKISFNYGAQIAFPSMVRYTE